MNNIYFSEYSIGRFSLVLLSLIVVLFFIFKGSQSKSTRWLILTFTSYFFFSLGYFIGYSVYGPLGSWGWYVTSFGSFGPIAFIQYAYRFPDHKLKKESRLVLFISTAIFLLAVMDYCINSAESPVLSTSTHFGSNYASRFLPVYWMLANIWAIVVFFRQSAVMESACAKAAGQSYSIRRFFFPKDRLARGARNFAVLMILELALSFSTALFMSFSIISLSTFNMISSGGMLIIVFMYIMVYINNSPEANTFMVKLVGISMVTTFLVIGGMSTVVMINHDDAYTEIRKNQLPHIAELIGRKGAEFPGEVRFIIASGNPGRLVDPVIIYSRDPDFRVPGTLRFWEKPPSIRNILRGENVSSLFDDRGKVRNVRFFTQISDQNYFYFSCMKNNVLHGVGYDFIQYRKFMHERAFFLLLVVSGVSLLILFFYPILFYTGLVLPLNNLLEGVRRVDSGDLDVNIPIQFRDEIGYLSELFNKMVASIKDKNRSLDDYAANLESKVVERTRELEKERHLLFDRNKIIENDLSLARKIQQGLVPRTSPVKFISLLYKPMELVGGDFYDFIRFRNSGRIGIFIGDVSGHGVPAAFITSMVKTTILQSGSRKDNPAELLSYMNSLLMNQTADNFITAFYGIYNQEDKRLIYSNAGHPQPYLITDDGIHQLSKETSIALAIFPNDLLAKRNIPYRNYEEILPVNSKLLLCTDGLTETRPMNGDIFFEDEKMLEVIAKIRNLPSDRFVAKLYESLIAYRGEETFEDDISLVCLDVF